MAFAFHSGELELQTRAGVRDTAARVAKSIYSSIPEAAGAFLKERQLVVLATTDSRNRPWASLLTGSPGFARPLDEHTISIDALLANEDPLATSLKTGALAGILAPDLSTRRRLRANGHLEMVDRVILLHIDQVYSNCPKYIQLRVADRESTARPSRLIRHSSSLLPHQQEWIRNTDTFFIASLTPDNGADASHRGGMPGFVRIENGELLWRDYPGNAMFNTLGNIVNYPRAGILVPDFTTGSTLQITGGANIDSAPRHSPSGAEVELRVRFRPEEVVEMEGVLPQRLRLVEYSPFNPESP